MEYLQDNYGYIYSALLTHARPCPYFEGSTASLALPFSRGTCSRIILPSTYLNMSDRILPSKYMYSTVHEQSQWSGNLAPSNTTVRYNFCTVRYSTFLRKLYALIKCLWHRKTQCAVKYARSCNIFVGVILTRYGPWTAVCNYSKILACM